LAELATFKDNWDEWDPYDVPIFFHIPNAGGSTVKYIMVTCHRFDMATETGIQDRYDDDKVIDTHLQSLVSYIIRFISSILGKNITSFL